MSRPAFRKSAAALIELLLFAVLFVLHYTDLLKITVLHASPMLLLPFLAALAMFLEELPAALAGAAGGIFADSVSGGGFCFHTLFFFLTCFTISLLVHYLLNNNFRTAIMLSLLTAIAYYLLRWLAFHAFTGADNSIDYLMQYALPSALYTAVFFLPFYFLQRLIHRFRSKGG